MLDDYIPLLVDKELFSSQYISSGTRMEVVIEHLGWVCEAKKEMEALEMMPNDRAKKRKIWTTICGMQHDLPLGNCADKALQGLKHQLHETEDYRDLRVYSIVLDDLLLGYRKVLRARHEEL